MDVTATTVPELERYILENVDRIKQIGKGRITLKAITECMGVTSKTDAKMLATKLRKSSFIQSRGGSYHLKSETVPGDADPVIDADPSMSAMRDALGEINDRDLFPRDSKRMDGSTKDK